MLANTINIGLCLSSAVLGGAKAKLPMIGKLDIGPSAEGFVRLIQEAVGPARRHEAIFVTMQFAPGYEFNAFDLQVGCEYPLPLEKAFLQNFLALLTLPPDETTPFEGMAQMISLVIDEAYRRCTEVPDGAPKRYRKGSSRSSTRRSRSIASGCIRRTPSGATSSPRSASETSSASPRSPSAMRSRCSRI